MPNPYQPTPGTGVLFDAIGAPPQTGTTQMGKLFPTTITVASVANLIPIVNGLPAIGSGQFGHADLLNSGNKCGGIFSPGPNYGQVLLDFAGAGASSGVTLTVEIGRLLIPGAVPNVLASAVLTTGTLTLGAGTIDPFTGLTRTSTAWRFFDAVTTTAYSKVGDVLPSVSGTASQGPAQILLNCAPFAGAWGYVMITALDASFTEILCCISPTS